MSRDLARLKVISQQLRDQDSARVTGIMGKINALNAELERMETRQLPTTDLPIRALAQLHEGQAARSAEIRAELKRLEPERLAAVAALAKSFGRIEALDILMRDARYQEKRRAENLEEVFRTSLRRHEG